MKVVVAGATGFIGAPLCRALRDEGHAVVALSRDAAAARDRLGAGIQAETWDARAGGDWEAALGGAGAVINLAGESFAAKRWSPEQKERLRASRVEATNALVGAIEKASPRPGVLVNASGVGYYGPHGDETITEESPPGNDFVAGLTQAWEAAARGAEASGTRVVCLRIGFVLGDDGGGLPKMAMPFRLFAGGPIGSGRQWVPWIHRDDVIGMALWAMETDAVRGGVNATAPNPVTMRDFAAALGRALHRPSWAPVPVFVLRILLGEMADLAATGQRALPAVAQRLGYAFRYPELDAALRNALGQE